MQKQPSLMVLITKISEIYLMNNTVLPYLSPSCGDILTFVPKSKDQLKTLFRQQANQIR